MKTKNTNQKQKKLKYDIGKNEFLWNIEKKNIQKTLNDTEKYMCYEEQYIETNIKKDIENEIKKVKKFNIIYRNVKAGMERIKKRIQEIRKNAKERETLKKIEKFNKNAGEKDPKDTKKIWNFLNAIKRNAKEESATKFCPLEKKNGELTKTLAENIERWEEWVKDMFFKEDTTPNGFYFKDEIWEENCEEIRRRIEEIEPNGKKDTKKAKNMRKNGPIQIPGKKSRNKRNTK